MMSLLLASSRHMPVHVSAKQLTWRPCSRFFTGAGIDASIVNDVTSEDLKFLSSSRTFKWCHFFLHPLGICPCTTQFKRLIIVWINIHLVLLVADQSTSPEYVTLFSKNLSVWIIVVGWGNFKLEKKVEKLQMRLQAILKVVSWSALKCGELISFC